MDGVEHLHDRRGALPRLRLSHFVRMDGALLRRRGTLLRSAAIDPKSSCERASGVRKSGAAILMKWLTISQHSAARIELATNVTNLPKDTCADSGRCEKPGRHRRRRPIGGARRCATSGDQCCRMSRLPSRPILRATVMRFVTAQLELSLLQQNPN